MSHKLKNLSVVPSTQVKKLNIAVRPVIAVLERLREEGFSQPNQMGKLWVL